MTVTTTVSDHGARTFPRPHVVGLTEVAWTADTNGDAAETITGFDGRVWRVVTVPGAGGLAPTDDYDVTIVDTDGLDILGGAGADRDTSNAEAMDLSSVAPLVHFGDLVVTVAAAGSENAGTVKVYWSSP
jgi:hypothetical protein